MVYLTVMQTPSYRQMTIEEFLFEAYNSSVVISKNTTGTKTYEFSDDVSERFKSKIDVNALIEHLRNFNKSTKLLRECNRQELYSTFFVPKKSGGLRRIDAPNPELMDALRRLKTIFEESFYALYHTSAFAYIKGRSTIDAVKRHQKNESKWFGKYDLSNFFGNTTLEFIINQLSMVFPFSEVLKTEEGQKELRMAVDLAMLNGGLPQGTPISPLITNVMMIPVDFKISKALRSDEKQSYVYTRYADDFIISSKYGFDVQSIEKIIVGVLRDFNAPFTINPSKTRYGSSAGRNWNLGVMLNKDNDITIGHKKKKQFQCMLHNYILDRRNGIAWDKHDVQVLDGYCNYYKMVEREAIEGIIQHIDKKMGVDVMMCIKEDLK